MKYWWLWLIIGIATGSSGTLAFLYYWQKFKRWIKGMSNKEYKI